MSFEGAQSLGSAGAAQAQVAMSQHEGAVVAAFSGEIDISNVGDAREAMLQVPDLGTGLVVDLTQVDFMDSSAISLLHEIAQRVRRRREGIVVVCPPEVPSRRMLELSGLDERVDIVDAVAEAVQRLDGAAPDAP